MKKISVSASNGRYAVLCGRGALARSARAVAAAGPGGGIYLVSSPRVWKCWGKRIEQIFRGKSQATILFDDREAAKNLKTVEQICGKLLRAGADRHALLVAVGGGVVGDVTGFVASSYGRGVRLVHIPTTLVAQVDSAIGGKTGVNLPEGKNLVGAFYPPELVLADPDVLRTLPPREFRSGIYEVIKYAAIGDVPLFHFLEKKMDRLLRRDPAALDYVIQRSVAQKARVVSRDEHDLGLRETLNFGHTFAHALETVTRYRKYLHGEAVGWGMIAASQLAVATNMFSSRDASRLTALIARVGLLPPWPDASPDRLALAMQSDKKKRDGRLRFVLLTRIGKAQCGVEVAPEEVLRTLRLCSSTSLRRKHG